jgi:hypothetical protein
MKHVEPGTTVSSQAYPGKWLRIEAIEPDGSVLLSFSGEPEKGLATLASDDWAGMVEEYKIMPAPLSPSAP